MKKLFVLFAVLFVLFAASGPVSAFTLKEHVSGVKTYLAALNKSPGIQKIYCDSGGAVVDNPADMAGSDYIRYLRGERDYAVELRPVGDAIWLVTINPEFKLPDGSSVGDPIEKIMVAALIPGDYSNNTNGDVRTHIWVRDGIATAVAEQGGKIASIMFYNTIKEKGVTVNKDYAAFLTPGADEEKKPPAAQQPSPIPAGGFGNIIKLSITEENVNLLSAPETKGKVLDQAYTNLMYIAEAQPIQGKDGKSKWYKLLLAINEMDGSMAQINKLPNYGLSYLYVSAEYVTQEQLTEDDERELEWLVNGRPPLYKIGDEFDNTLFSAKTNSEEPFYAPLKEGLTLFSEPNNSAKGITVPKGAKILANPADYVTEDYYVHVDMDEKEWAPVTGEDHKIIGWIKIGYDPQKEERVYLDVNGKQLKI
jgi:hypothetical protein